MSQDKNNSTDGGQRYIFTRETGGMTILLLSAVILVMLLSNDAIFASVGAGVCTFMFGTFGYGCFLVLALLCYLGVYLVWNRKISVPGRWVAPICLTTLCVFLLFHSVSAYAFGISPDEGYGAFISDCYRSASAGFSGYTFGGVISSLIVYPVARLTTYVGAFVVFAVLSVVFAGLIFYAVRRSFRGGSSSIKIVNGSIRRSYRNRAKSGHGKEAVLSSPDFSNQVVSGTFPDGTRYAGGDPSLDPNHIPYGGGNGVGSGIASRAGAGYVDSGNGQYGFQAYYPDGYYDQGGAESCPPHEYDSTNWKDREISSADAYDPDKFTRDDLGKKILFGSVSDSDSYYKNMLYDENSYFHGSNGNDGYQGGGGGRAGRTDMYRGSDDDYLKSLGLYRNDGVSSSNRLDGSTPGVNDARSDIYPGPRDYPTSGDSIQNEAPSSAYDESGSVFSESFRSTGESSGYTPQGYIYGENPSNGMEGMSDNRFTRDETTGESTDRHIDFDIRHDAGSDEGTSGFDGGPGRMTDDPVPGLTDDVRRGVNAGPAFGDFGITDEERNAALSEPDGLGVESRGKGVSGARRRFEDLFEGENDEYSSFGSDGRLVRDAGISDGSTGFRDVRGADDMVRPGRISPRSLIDSSDSSDEDHVEIKQEKKPHVWKRYKAPGMDLLKDYPELGVTDETEIQRNKEAIVEALEDYRIESEVMNVIVGCKITRYDVRILNNTQMVNAEKHARDIQLALKKETINVYINYKISALSVEVPNRKSGTIGLKSLLESKQFQKAEHGGLAFGLGKNMEGECICPDITDMPHLLIAGTTGSGKSVCLNSMIISLIYKYSPEELRIILIDPKQVEFVPYSGLPHLMIDEIPSSVDKVIKLLNWTIAEMERRYALFKDMTVSGKATKDIREYNENVSNKQDRLCNIIVVMDEFGDLMMQARKEIEGLIIRLVQKSRACGIHLILATQRPSVDCITGLIKSNLPARIGFKVNSFKDSTTIFDRGGAEKLLGSGDMLFRRPDRDELVRIQGCYVSSAEVQAVTNFVKENNETYFDDDLKEYIDTVDTPETGGQRNGGEDPDAKFDETYVKVLGFCVMQNTASVSMIQRHFPIGYMKACKIVDWMENMNYISASEGSKPRKVLLSRDEFIATYGEDELNG